MLLNYTNFFNFHECSKEDLIKTSYDFNTNMAVLLNEIGCNPYFIRSIYNTVFSSMTSDKVYYHTPVHILSMLTFADLNNIKLQPWEKLAIFFHDVIYKPGSKNNEINSIQFMMALLDGTGISESIKMQSASAIQATAMHLEQEWEPEFNTLMDLDMSGFSANKDSYNIQNDCIKKEFCQPDLNRYDGVTLENFNKGRISFLTNLKNKKSIYRTDLFLNKFEQKAQENCINSIKELTNA
jgi:predicted metal-dependent HD superfamily phosphohydrolase